MKIELNRIAIWQPILGNNISVHPHPRGTEYLEKGNDEPQISREAIYRFVKNYTKDDLRFSLIVRSKANQPSVIDAELAKAAKKLDRETILAALEAATISEFTYTDYYLKEDK